MSKIINIFNISIYQELIKRFNYDLRQFEKYYNINEKMYGYLEKKDYEYICNVYVQDLLDIINSNLFDIFVPPTVKKDIKKKTDIIKVQKNTKNYFKCLTIFKEIFNLINVDLPENFD